MEHLKLDPPYHHELRFDLLPWVLSDLKPRCCTKQGNQAHRLGLPDWLEDLDLKDAVETLLLRRRDELAKQVNEHDYALLLLE